MTPQQKAKDLFNKYYLLIDIKNYENTKNCALIAVDELLEATKRYDYTLGPNPSYNDYWLRVKYEIEKL
jgi:NifU-like protein involved in Fe-S cluster formation